MPEPVISRPKAADRGEIEDLFEVVLRDTFEREGLIDTHASDLRSEIKAQKRLLQRDLASGGRDEHFLIARLDERIVGTIGYGPANDIICEHLDADFKITPEIKSAYVLPDLHGQGIGRLLLRAVIDKLRTGGVSQYCLDCGYRQSQPVWSHLLGEPTLVLHDHWAPGAHHMIWLRRIL